MALIYKTNPPLHASHSCYDPISRPSSTFKICVLITLVASPALGMTRRSWSVMTSPLASLFVPYLSVITSGCRFFDVIFTTLPSARRLCTHAMPRRCGISRKTYKCVGVTNRWLKQKINGDSRLKNARDISALSSAPVVHVARVAQLLTAERVKHFRFVEPRVDADLVFFVAVGRHSRRVYTKRQDVSRHVKVQ